MRLLHWEEPQLHEWGVLSFHQTSVARVPSTSSSYQYWMVKARSVFSSSQCFLWSLGSVFTVPATAASKLGCLLQTGFKRGVGQIDWKKKKVIIDDLLGLSSCLWRCFPWYSITKCLVWGPVYTGDFQRLSGNECLSFILEKSPRYCYIIWCLLWLLYPVHLLKLDFLCGTDSLGSRRVLTLCTVYVLPLT